MADGSGVKQFSEEIEQATKEVGSDVKDSVGEAIEQGIQSITATPLTPQQIQQKQVQDQKKLVQARKTIKWYQDVATSQKRVRDEDKQNKLQKQQQEEQEKSNKIQLEQKKKVLISPAKKAPQVPGQPASETEEIARTRQEIGKGHGIGG